MKQPNGCFNPAGFAATPLRIKMLAHFVEQQFSSSSSTPQKQKGPTRGPFHFLARPERFELPTARFVAEYSIQLSYGRIGLVLQNLAEREGFEPSKGF